MIDGKRLGVCIAAALLAAALSFPLPALAAMNADQVKAKVAKAFGVKVLKVRPGKVDGRKVFVVTIMNPGGNFDEAFQVSTIVVDVNWAREHHDLWAEELKLDSVSNRLHGSGDD